MKVIDLNKLLCPKEWEVITDKDGNQEFTFLDQELDPIKCTFDFAGGVVIDTEDYTHISLSGEMLYMIAGMVEEIESSND